MKSDKHPPAEQKFAAMKLQADAINCRSTDCGR